ncbi:nucleotide disphospho-sugar-binding domain-containing protein [Dactylosporangium sp. McL0621]|uniref:nucleotide disphospho-sugar-binding domain-containing protein n=1 Tax=Dactylosporangium sp. McL0621 TaxID=3415678 RepID=UPI003CF8C473
MRILFTSWAWPSHLHPMIPLAWAARLAGHDVLVAGQPAIVPEICAAGLPAARIGTDVDLAALIPNMPGGPARARAAGRPAGHPLSIFTAMAGAMLPGLTELVGAWRPDVIVHEPTTYAAPIVAARFGLPHVRHLWGVDFPQTLRGWEAEALAPLAAEAGVAVPDPRGAFTVDPCPPGLQLEPDGPRQAVRHVPYNRDAIWPGPLPRAADRPRVCVTWGSVLGRYGGGGSDAARVVGALAKLDVDVVVTVAARDRAGFGAVPDNVVLLEHAPLAQLLPGCAAIVSPGGGGTFMTAVVLGVPQVICPGVPDQRLNAVQLAKAGAGLDLGGPDPGDQELRDAVEHLLAGPGFAARAAVLRDESAAAPDPTEVLRRIEALTSQRIGDQP